MSKQSNQRYRKEVLKNNQDSIKNSVKKENEQNSVTENSNDKQGNTKAK